MAQPRSVLGIDIATQVLHVVGMDDRRHVVRRKRLARRTGLTCMANVPPRRLGMAAGGSAHDWARQCREQGHDVRLIAPPGVNAEVQSPKPEARAAEASGAAVTRPTMRCVPLKRVAQPDLHARPRVRERLSKARTALDPASRGRLRAAGISWTQRRATLRALLVDKRHAAQATLTTRSAAVCGHLDAACRALETRWAYDAAPRAALGPAPPACPRLQTSPGLGPVTAPALRAALGDVTQGTNGRQVAAWLGVGPRAPATGGPPRRLGIRTRAERSRRTRLVHGARATRRWVDPTCDARRQGRRARIARRGTNRAAVAWAHPHARMVWALLAHTQA
jgi:transposase